MLSHKDWGEADRLIWLFTREQGKMRALGKGVRKARSRKAGHLEPFTRVSLQLAQSHDLPIITQAEALDTFPLLREDLERIGLAAYVIELLDRFTYEEGENQSLYRLLVETLERLNRTEHQPIVLRFYEVRLLDLVGFRPQLFECTVCTDTIQPADQFFSAEHGGVVCPKCAGGLGGIRPASREALQVLRHCQRSSYLEAARLPVSIPLEREVEQIMHYYFTFLLERNLNTPAFLRRVRQQKAEQ